MRNSPLTELFRVRPPGGEASGDGASQCWLRRRMGLFPGAEKTTASSQGTRERPASIKPNRRFTRPYYTRSPPGTRDRMALGRPGWLVTVQPKRRSPAGGEGTVACKIMVSAGISRGLDRVCPTLVYTLASKINLDA